MTISALIFDLDGTLVDSETPGLQVLHAMACEAGAPWTFEQAHARFQGVPMSACIADMVGHLPPHRLPLDEVDFLRRLRVAMAERFRQGLQEISGARALLQSLTLPFAIATNGPREKAELTLSLTGLRSLLGERVFCAPEVGSFKPEPQLFWHAAKHLGVPPAHCAVVEDSLPGVQAGLAAGMRVFTLHSGQGMPKEMARQVTFIQGLPDLQPYL